MYGIGCTLFCICLVLPGSMILKIVSLSCLAKFLWLQLFLFVSCYRIQIYYLPLVWNLWIHCTYHLFPSLMWVVSWWVNLSWILHSVSLTVVYISCNHGLYHHSCYLSCYLGYGFSDTCLSDAIIVYLSVCLETASLCLNTLKPPLWDCLVRGVPVCLVDFTPNTK